MTTALPAALALVLATPPTDLPLSFGAGSCGKLTGGTALPCRGPNFSANTVWSCLLGRNFVHPLVREAVESVYGRMPAGRQWTYGETGLEEGGPLWPHRTHQNGLSVDFLVPMVDANGRPSVLATSPLNGFGYGIDLGADGSLGESRIDWQALATHLLALEAASQERGMRIKRIIFAPHLRDLLLLKAPEVKRLRGLFNEKRAWVLHDDHYHVDFDLPARFRKPLSCPKP